MADNTVERIVKETEEDFHAMEEDLQKAMNLMQEIKKDLQEGELAVKKGVAEEGHIEPGADLEGNLRRDIKEMESDVRELHEVMADMNERTEKFANLMGAWEDLPEAFHP